MIDWLAADPWAAGLAALVLLATCLFLVVAELFIISGGLLAIAAMACAIAAVTCAFLAHPVLGWIALVLTPGLLAIALRRAFAHLLTSSAVPQTVIDSNAGYGLRAEALGVAVGDRGRLVTAAMPTGRARFGSALIDVRVHGPVLEHGASVRVTRIEGAEVVVVADTTASSPTPPSIAAQPPGSPA